MPFKSKQHNC